MSIPLYFYQTVNLINALLSIFLAIIVFKYKRALIEGTLFSLFAFLVAFWAFFFYLAILTNSYLWARFFFRTCMIGAALIPPVFIEFAFALIKKKMPGILRFINIGLAIVILSTIYSKIYALDGGPFLGFLYWPEVGWTSALSILLYIINVGVGHYYLLLAIKQGNPFQKKQLSIVMIGTFLSFLGAGTNFLLWFRIPFPPIFNILIPLYIISVAYAITTHRFMNVRLVINRIVAYSLLITIYALLSLAAIYLYSKVLPFGINSPTLFFLCILIIAGGLFFHPLRLHLQTTPDRFLFRKKYEYEQAIREFGEACQSVIDPAKLIGLFKDKNKNLIKMKAGKVYLINKGGDFKLSLFIPK